MSLKGYAFAGMLAVTLAFAGGFCAYAQGGPDEVAPAPPVTITSPPVTAEAPPEALPENPETATPAVGASKDNRREKRIEQRVDGQNVSKPIKPVRKTPKNVMRIDDKTKRKVQPVAVIKTSLSPWGYTRRYLAGEVVRPRPKSLPGAQGLPGAAGRPGAGIALGIGGGSGRRADEEDEDY